MARAVKYRLQRLLQALPTGLRQRMIRERHLRLVNANQQHLVDPAYLGKPPADVVTWITPEGLPELPTAAALALTPLDAVGMQAARAWLATGPFDSDAMLVRRTDNHGDELGRVTAALRQRLAIADVPSAKAAGNAPLTGNDVLVDARSLQTAAFGTRGIGRFARSALLAVRAAVGDDRCVLVVDPARDRLPLELAGNCRQVVWPKDASSYAVLVQPSPMTASSEPLLDVLAGPALAIAIAYDFIPLHYPTIYLRHAATRLEYAAALDALRHYDAFIAISHDTQQELHRFLGSTPQQTTVAWPSEVLPQGNCIVPTSDPVGPIVIMTGDEPRKNTYGALAAVGAATAGTDATRDVVVIGMAGQQQRVHHWSIAAGMRPGEARTLDRIDDATMHRLLAEAPVVVVASFDEGLSLPVIEALTHGTPVVAADIPAHRELIGRAKAMAAPGDLRALAKSIRRTAKHR
ncbi:MAG: glycosyltransferase, partial [Actinomycetales bacterium]